MQFLLARRVLKAYDFEKGGDKYNRYFQPNSAALEAFQKRKENLLGVYRNHTAILFAKKIMDDVSYEYANGQNILTMRKKYE